MLLAKKRRNIRGGNACSPDCNQTAPEDLTDERAKANATVGSLMELGPAVIPQE